MASLTQKAAITVVCDQKLNCRKTTSLLADHLFQKVLSNYERTSMLLIFWGLYSESVHT